jgi:hypothetical protein
MGRASVVTAVAAVALLIAPTALSALVVQLKIAPERPRAGQRITLYLRTFAPIVDESQPCRFRPEPWRLSYAFRVAAIAPEGTSYPIRVRQGDDNVYVGTFRLARKAGPWTIRLLNFNASDPCSGASLRFRVRK